MLALRAEAVNRVGQEIERYAFRKALEEFMGFARERNRHFDERAPWKSNKENKPDCAAAMYTAAQLVLTLGCLMRPFMPNAAAKVFAMLGVSGSEPDWAGGGACLLESGKPLAAPEVLFTKIDDAAIEEELARLQDPHV
jgi:methionyl-tRNA synthetase